MRKTKILMVMTALVLVVVGVLVAVTSVLSATQQSVTSSLQVTYTANNVKATVSVASRTQSGSFSSPSSSNPVQTVSFEPASPNSATAALAANTVALGSFETENAVSTFQRYAVYKFSFQNTYTSSPEQGTPLKVTFTYKNPTSETYRKNVDLLWVAGCIGSDPSNAPAFNGTGDGWATTQNNLDSSNANKYSVLNVTGDGSTVNNLFTSGNKVPRGQTFNLYLYVMIVDPTIPAVFNLPGDANGCLTFTLDGTEAS